MFGASILARTLSKAVPTGHSGEKWQYHSRGDRHSKVACWGVLFDLMRTSRHLKDHVSEGKVAFGINHQMRDFKQNRKKDLDLVLCRPASTAAKRRTLKSFGDLVRQYEIELNATERRALAELPVLPQAPVASVMVAVEAKACMTAHVKAMPRLFDELNSSHQTVHGASESVIAAGFVMINLAKTFASPGRVGYCPHCNHKVTPINEHHQPEDAMRVMRKIEELPRRGNVQESGFDAVAIVLVDCPNDGTPVKLISRPPAPAPDDIFHYDKMIERLAHLYDSRFPRG